MGISKETKYLPQIDLSFNAIDRRRRRSRRPVAAK